MSGPSASVVTLLFCSLLAVSLAQNSGCLEKGDSAQKAYFGWPILISCDNILNECEDDLYDYYDTNVSCSLRFTGENETLFQSDWFDVWNDSYPVLNYQISNVSANATVEITLHDVLNDVCCIERVNLSAVALPDLSCEMASADEKNTQIRRVIEGQPEASLLCKVLVDSGEPDLDTSNYIITWYYDCSTNLPNGTRQDDATGKLQIGSLDHSKHPGKYSCSVTHNGQRRFVEHHDLCIQPEKWSSLVAVRCEREEYFTNEGSTVDVTCSVEISEGRDDPTNYLMVFNPLYDNETVDHSKDNISCTSTLGGNWTVAPDDRVSCLFSVIRNASEEEYKCFGSIPTEQEWERERNKTIRYMEMKYRMRNVRTEDFGKFQALAKNVVSKDNSTDIYAISKKSDSDRIAKIVGGTLGGCLFLIIIVIICFVFRLQIKYYWRMSRFVPFEQHPLREFGVYLKYHYDANENQNPKYKALIENISQFMEMINCPVNDPNRVLDKHEGHYENIRQVQRSCDRVMIVLTPEYLGAVENDFHLIVNPEIKFVVIMDSQVDLEDIEDKNRRNELRDHIRRSHVINWDGNGQLSKEFKMRLTLAMPKRPPNANTEAAVVFRHENGENGYVNIPNHV